MDILSHILLVYKVQHGRSHVKWVLVPQKTVLDEVDENCLTRIFFVKICKYLRTTNLISQVFSEPIHTQYLY